MKKKTARGIVSALLILAVAATFAAIAADVGSQGDPLVTLSYLQDVYTGDLMEKTDVKLQERNAALTRELEQKAARLVMGQSGDTGSGGVYSPLELADGQTLWCAGGCEIMLRSGGGVCISVNETPGLVDTTDGTTLGNGGGLKVNHLYMAPSDRGIRCSGSTLFLIRGDYMVQ